MGSLPCVLTKTPVKDHSFNLMMDLINGAMNFSDPIIPQSREAKLRYFDAEYEVLVPGEFVRCGITNDPIRLESLKYWSVERQIAFRSAEVSFEDFLKTEGKFKR